MRDCAELVMLRSKALQTDDTPVSVLDASLPRTRTGRIWTGAGDRDHPYTVYGYTPARNRDGPDVFMNDFHGYLQADAYSGYDEIYNDRARNIAEVAGWAHLTFCPSVASGSARICLHNETFSLDPVSLRRRIAP